MKLVTKYQISAINSCWENATKNEHICSMCIKINKVGKREVGIWWVQKRYPQYGIHIWSLWPNIRFLPDFYTHWTYMLIFRRIFLSNYWWQKSDIWSQASYRYPISWEAFLDPSDSKTTFFNSHLKYVQLQSILNNLYLPGLSTLSISENKDIIMTVFGSSSTILESNN
jgi:hypothetical protein